MTDSVTFPAALGGNNKTITNDGDPVTGLDNDGHRRDDGSGFVGCLGQVVVMAGTAVDAAQTATTKAGEASASASTASTAATQASNAATSATNAANSAIAADASATDAEYWAGQASANATGSVKVSSGDRLAATLDEKLAVSGLSKSITVGLTEFNAVSSRFGGFTISKVHKSSTGRWFGGAGGTGYLRYSDDSGGVWSVSAGVTAGCNGIASNGSVIIAVGHSGEVFKSADNGANFSSVSSGTAQQLNDVEHIGGGVFIAAGNSGVILRSADNGGTWSLISSGVATNLWGVAFLGSVVIAAGSSGVIRRSVDGGLSFAGVTSGFGTTQINDVSCSALSGTFIAVGNSGVMTKSVDNGATWSAVTSGFGTTTINDVSGSGDVWVAVGSSGVMTLSTDDGDTWTPITSGFGTTMISSVTIADGVVLASGSSGVITKALVSEQLLLTVGDSSAASVAFTPAGNIAATNVQLAIEELDGEKAKLAGGNTFTGTQIVAGVTDTVHAATGTSYALTNANGLIVTWVLTANSTITDSLTTGQSVLLQVTPSTFTLTFPTVVWTKAGGGGAAPTLYSSGKTNVLFWKVGSTLYGTHLGDA